MNKNIPISTPYQNTIIYFLSGTGNSYRISEPMQSIADDKDLKTIKSSVNSAKPTEEIKDNNTCILGLIFPIHGFTAPWYMIKFTWRLPQVKKAHAFCAATRAGFKFAKVFTPGISSSATFLIALILFFKGYKVQGVTSFDMPSNWYSLHPIQKEKSIRQIIERATLKTSTFTNIMLAGKQNWFTWTNLYEISWTIVLTPISLGYIMVGRLFFAKMFFANKNCDGCSICSKNCPVNAIEMRGKEKPKPFWKYSCESCII